MPKPTVVVTHGEGLDGRLASSLRARGMNVLALPTISIEPAADYEPLDRALGDIDRFDWIVFTSRHAVEAVLTRPSWTLAKHAAVPGLRVAAVGKATAARLSELGVTPDVVPAVAGGADLLLALLRAPSSGATRTRILWPRSDIARRELPEALRRAGAELVEPIAYRTVPAGSAESLAGFLDRLAAGTLDAVTFLSPSGARNLSAMLGRPDLSVVAEHAAIASLGPTTSEALRELGAPPSVESAARTAEDLAETLAKYLLARGGRDLEDPRDP